MSADAKLRWAKACGVKWSVDELDHSCFNARAIPVFTLRGPAEIAQGEAGNKSRSPSLPVLLRDYYGSMCPNGFVTSSTKMWQCVPMTEYEGPCFAETANFDGFTVRALEKWSQKCKAFWPCLDVSLRDLEMELETASFPLSLAATASRLS